MIGVNCTKLVLPMCILFSSDISLQSISILACVLFCMIVRHVVKESFGRVHDHFVNCIDFSVH